MTSKSVAADRLPRTSVRSCCPALVAASIVLKRGDGGRAFLRIMRGFERKVLFEARTLGALARRADPAQGLWGVTTRRSRSMSTERSSPAALGAERVVPHCPAGTSSRRTPRRRSSSTSAR